MPEYLRFILFIVFLHLPAFGYAQPGTGKDWILSPADTDKVEIDIRPTYNGKTLQLTAQYYVNAHGDTFYIDQFRVYLTNIGLAGRKNATAENSHLFDAEDTATYSFVLKNIPPGVYSSLTFTAGVDSAANTSGANGGDLDPAKGMYWAWNSGYIMAKLEGHSNACKTLHNAFEFHIGGYMPPYNTARQVSLKIPEHFQVGRPSLPTISINADVGAMLRDIDLSKVNSILIPGKDAAMMADRYARMFSIESVFFTPLSPR